MRINQSNDRFTWSQAGALVSLGVIATWNLVLLWMHLSEPMELDRTAAVFLFTVTASSLGLLPLYGLRIRWGYLVGVLLYLWMFAGATLTVVERNYFFSVSAYNLIVIFIYLTALAGIALSVQAYRGRPATSRRNSGIGVGVYVLAVALIGYTVGANFDDLTAFRARRVQNRIASRLAAMDTLDEKLAFLVEKGDLPSLTAGIVVGDELVWSRAFGAADLNTAYGIGSVTKMFTATAVMQLYERGLIDLDDDISQHLPFEVRHPDNPDQPITIQMLLSHRSGLAHLTIPQEIYFRHDKAYTDWLNQTHGWSLETPSPRPPLTDYLAGLLDPDGPYYFEGVWAEAKPGRQHIYANTNYYLLTALIENVTGRSFSDYLGANVLAPLDMSSSGFDPAALGGLMAIGYEREFAPLSRTNLTVPVYQNVPGPGGLISTVPDLSRFLIAQINGGAVGQAQLLAPDSVARMHRKLASGGGHINKVGYGLGFTQLAETPWEYYGHFYGMNGAVGHEGGQLGYSAALYCVEKGESGYGFVLLTNESHIESGADFTWYFPIYYQINTLLMEEAAARYEHQGPS